MCHLSLQVPYSLHTDLQTRSSRSPSGLATSTAASTPSSIHAPTRSSKRLFRVYWEFTVWGGLPDRTTTIWVQVKVKLKVKARASLWASTAGGLPVDSAPPRPWPFPELLPPGTAGNGKSFPWAPSAEGKGRSILAETRLQNCATKASDEPVAASSALEPPHKYPQLLETFLQLKYTNCPCRKKESLYSPLSIIHCSGVLLKIKDETMLYCNNVAALKLKFYLKIMFTFFLFTRYKLG